jgi:probable HAF family extracellular repeat protein
MKTLHVTNQVNARFAACSASHRAGTRHVLSTTDEFPNGGAEGINDKGQIVGLAYDSDFADSHAFMWPNSNSPGIDLNTLIPSDSGWELALARGVNNRGEITGQGYLNGVGHACVLIPVRGPTAAAAPRPRQ